MQTRTRVAAIIIKERKILLLKSKNPKYKEFWTPGGKIEEGESDLVALKRELNEEIHADLVSAEFFGEYESISQYHEDTVVFNRVYLVKIKGSLKPDHEIGSLHWLTKDELFERKSEWINIYAKIFDDLVEKNLF